MLSIQQAGSEILQNVPGKFYIFCGPEYGVKEKYLSALKNYYQGRYTELSEVQSLLDLMRTKHLIPLEPQLYIVRYDELFLGALKETTASTISSAKIIGTLVVIYHESKSLSKCDKFLPNYTVSFDKVASVFVKKYLVQDYPGLNNSLIDFAMKSRDDYKGSSVLCNLLNQADIELLNRVGVDDLDSIFYGPVESADEHIKLGFAARNFKFLVDVIETYPGELDSVLYIMLSTLVELDKLKAKQYTDSPLKQYIKGWTLSDIYNMYMIVFNSLEELRTVSSDAYSQIIYLSGILQYQTIPSLEALKEVL